MDAGLRARTKQFIEFGLKISFTPCLPIRMPASYIVSNSLVRTMTQCNAEVNETTQLWRGATNNTQRY